MTTIVDDIEYYDFSYIKDRYPGSANNCQTLQKVIIKNNIPDDMYIFTSYSKNKGVYTRLPNDSTYRAKKLMIKKEWVENHFNINSNAKEDIDYHQYKKLPPKIILDKEEYLKDENGQEVSITIRGERKHNSIFFKAKDIGEMLKIDQIRGTLTHPDSKFTEGNDYIYFQNVDQHNNKDYSSNNTKVTYLTYTGFLRLLFIRKHPIANQFVRWATEKLFAIQFGTQEQKLELSAQISGVSIKSLKEYLNTTTSSMPVVYLFYLGQMKEVCEKMNIDRTKYPNITDSFQVFKYGLTNNFKRRAEEHAITFGKYNIKPTLKYHVHIDPCYLQEAENRLRDWFKLLDWHLQEIKQDFSELAVMSTNKADSSLNKLFHDLDKMYSGKVYEFKKEIETLKNDNKKDQDLIHLLRQQCITYENEKKEHKQHLNDIKTECKQTIDDNNKKHENTIALFKKTIDDTKYIFTKTIEDTKSIFTKNLEDNNKKYEDFIILQKEKDSLYQNTIALYQHLLKQQKI